MSASANHNPGRLRVTRGATITRDEYEAMEQAGEIARPLTQGPMRRRPHDPASRPPDLGLTELVEGWTNRMKELL